MTKIAHISDLHFDRVDPAAVEALVDDLNSLGPDVLVVSGDLTQRARRKQYEHAINLLRRLPTPQVVVPGNHDVPLYDFLRRLFDPYGRFARYAGGGFFPDFKNDEVHIVGINTACRLAPRVNGFWKDGKIRRSHLEELQRRFSDDGAGVRILVAHHPFIEPSGGHHHGIIHGAKQALPVLKSLGINLILSGHIHLCYRGDVCEQHATGNPGIVNLVAGSATSTRRRERFNSYNVIHVNERKLDIQVREFRSSAVASAPGSFVNRADGAGSS